jgi:hypothetical protein
MPHAMWQPRRLFQWTVILICQHSINSRQWQSIHLKLQTKKRSLESLHSMNSNTGFRLYGSVKFILNLDTAGQPSVFLLGSLTCTEAIQYKWTYPYLWKKAMLITTNTLTRRYVTEENSYSLVCSKNYFKHDYRQDKNYRQPKRYCVLEYLALHCTFCDDNSKHSTGKYTKINKWNASETLINCHKNVHELWSWLLCSRIKAMLSSTNACMCRLISWNN